MLSRSVTQVIAYCLDNILPLCVRDARWFMRPLFQIAFKKMDVRPIMNFKMDAYELSDKAFAETYRRNPSIFDGRGTDLTPVMQKNVVEAIGEADSVLDVGCGRGFLCKEIAARYKGARVVGLDMNKQFEDASIGFMQGFAEQLPFQDQSFDCVVCVHTLEHVKNLGRAISELKRVARKRVVVVVPRQRYFRFTLDFHLHFFYSFRALGCLFDLPYRGLDLGAECLVILESQNS